MSIPKYPVLITENTRHGRLPTPGVGFWVPLRAGNFATTSPGLSSATEVGSGHVAQDSPLRYKFPVGNTTAALRVAHDTSEYLLDSCLSLSTLPEDGQVVVAWEAEWGDQQTSGGAFWTYGQSKSDSSYYGVQLAATELPQFVFRAHISGSVVENTTLNLGSGTALSDVGWRGTVVRCVLGLRVTSIVNCTADIELRFGNGALSAVYTGTADFDAAGTPSSPYFPGRNDVAGHPGLIIGARMDSAGAYDRKFGNGAAHQAYVGNLHGLRLLEYDASIVSATLADMLLCRGEFAEPLLGSQS